MGDGNDATEVSATRPVVEYSPEAPLSAPTSLCALSASDSAYQHSRDCSVDAALSILAEREQHDLPFEDKLDTINHTLPAAIVLLLDAIYPSPGHEAEVDLIIERCHQIEGLLAPIRTAIHQHSVPDLAKSLAGLDGLLHDTLEQTKAKAPAPGGSWNEGLQSEEKELGSILSDLYFGESLPTGKPTDEQANLQINFSAENRHGLSIHRP